MRPLRLEIEGLASFRTRQTVDFTAIDELFAITGPTGAGKSTILDAMSLALFGELPRGGKNYKEFITLGMAQAKVAFTFAVGTRRFIAARTFQRKGSQSATLEEILPEGPTVPLSEDGGVVDVRKKAEALLGFDYMTFSRVVMLPQGEFAEFLRGDADERRRIIVRLLDCERYERAGSLARERAKEKEREAEMLGALLAREYADATPERLATLDETLQETTARAEDLQTILEAVEQDAARIAAVEQLLTQVAGFERGITDLTTKTATLAEALELLAPRQAAADVAFVHAEARVAATHADAESTRLALDSHVSSDGDDSMLATLRAAATDLGAAMTARDTLAAERAQADATVTAATAARDVAATTAATAEQELAAAHAALESTRQQLRDAVECRKTATTAAALTARVAEASAAVEAASQQAQAAEATLADATATLRACVSTRDAVVREHHVAALTTGLTVGAPCPVCVRPLETLPDTASEGHDALDRAAAAIADAEQSLLAATRNRDARQRAAMQAEAQHRALAEQLAGLPAAPTISDAQVAEAAAADAVEAAERVLRTTTTARQTAAEAHRRTEAELSRATAHRDALGRQTADLAARIERAEIALRPHTASLAAGDLLPAIDARIATRRTLRTAADAAAMRERDAQRALTEAQRGRAACVEELATLHQALEGLRERTRAASDRLGDVLDTRVGVDALLNVEGPALEQLEGLQAAHAHFATMINRQRPVLAGEREERTAAITRQLGAVGLSADRTLAATVERLRTECQRVRDTMVRTRAQRDTIAGKLDKRTSLADRVAEMRGEAERYKRLGNELRSDRFIKFILDESFKELALRASEELRLLSAGRYSMQADGYDFTVVDHWNADECRSVVTFSGGESFLASMSLAIALAQGIRDLAGDAAGTRLESVFVDEGFGSLDADTLDTVAEALERLQGTGRTVGVITHIGALAERMPGGLHVEPGPSGSQVNVRGA